MKLHLIMPMGGAGTRFLSNGIDCPKPLIMLQNKPFFYWATESILQSAEIASLTFVVLREHITRFSIAEKIRSFYPDARIVVLERVLAGAVLTALEGALALPADEAVIFNDCDHAFRCNALKDFTQGDTAADGALLTFFSDEPKFSFLDFDANGNVSRTVEKQVISNDAICGAYYFARVADFRANAARYLKTCEYSEYFMSGVYNELIRSGGIVKALKTDLHIPFGTPAEYEAAQQNPQLQAGAV